MTSRHISGLVSWWLPLRLRQRIIRRLWTRITPRHDSGFAGVMLWEAIARECARIHCVHAFTATEFGPMEEFIEWLGERNYDLVDLLLDLRKFAFGRTAARLERRLRRLGLLSDAIIES